MARDRGSPAVFGCLAAAGLPFIVVGAITVVSSLRSEEHGSDRLMGVAVGLVFAEAGVLALGLGLWLARQASRKTRLRQESSDRPWWNEGIWTDFRVSSGSPLGLAALWGVAVIVATIVSVFVAGTFGGEPASGAEKAVAGTFALISLALLAFATKRTLHALRYGWPTLHLSRVPVLPGTRLEGAIVVPASVYSSEGVKLTLRCSEGTEVKKREEGHTVTETEWRDVHESSADVAATDLRQTVAGGTLIPVAMDVPKDAPGRKIGALTCLWVLEAKAAGFGATFEVPVFEADPALVEKRSEPMPD